MKHVELAKKIYKEKGEDELHSDNALVGLDGPVCQTPLGSPEAVRSAMQQFVNNFRSGNHDSHNAATISSLLERVLSVDMDQKNNRRGDLPKALGLVHRPHRDYDRRILSLTVFELAEELRFEGGIARTREDAIEQVISALRSAGIADLTEDKALDLYKAGFQLD